MDHPILFIVLFILLLLSAFFSASETAYTSFPVIRMKNLAKTKKTAKMALKLKESYEKLISTILIGNNIVNIALTSIATVIFVEEGWSTGLCTAIITIVVLIFGEILPKTFSKIINIKFAMIVSYPLTVLFYVFYPITALFELITRGVKKLFKVKEEVSMTEEEFEILVDNIHDEGILTNVEKNLILNTIDYGDLLVEDIMTKNKKVIFVKDSDSLEHIQDVFETYNFSRLPIARNNKISSIYGIIYQKEFYEMLLNDEQDLKSIIIEPIYTKPTIKICRLLKTFQKEHQHMAIVKNGNKVYGLITMEDIIEELVGEIEDEYDEERDDAYESAEEQARIEEEKLQQDTNNNKEETKSN